MSGVVGQTDAVQLRAVLGDLTTQDVDVVVNAADTAMRGGGGVDGALHRAGGPTVLSDCIRRFPTGLATGDAGWTTAGDLPCRWVVHTVGPDHGAGQRDRSLLESCYRRALEVSQGLGARSVAFPLIGAGAHGWPRADAIQAAVDAVTSSPHHVDEVRLVTIDEETHDAVQRALARATPLRILQGVRALHRRGREGVRVVPGLSPSGFYWRVTVASADNLVDRHGFLASIRPAETISYSDSALTDFAGGEVGITTSPDAVADLILAARPGLDVAFDDPAYVAWFDGLVQLVERLDRLPVSFADYELPQGWTLGRGVVYPSPPEPPSGGSTA